MERIRQATEAEHDAAPSFNALVLLLEERVALGALRAFGYAPEGGAEDDPRNDPHEYREMGYAHAPMSFRGYR